MEVYLAGIEFASLEGEFIGVMYFFVWKFIAYAYGYVLVLQDLLLYWRIRALMIFITEEQT